MSAVQDDSAPALALCITTLSRSYARYRNPRGDLQPELPREHVHRSDAPSVPAAADVAQPGVQLGKLDSEDNKR